MKRFRIGVVGAGAIAQAAHIPGYAGQANVELAAIADPERRCLDEVRKRGWIFGREYPDHREMLKCERLDAISICTPNVFHKPIAVDCLQAECDLLLEKPVALSLADARIIQSTARKFGGRIMVCFTHRFNELAIAVRNAVHAGRIGLPYMIRIRFAHTGPFPGWARTDWFYHPKLAGGGAMLDMGIHAFDLIQWIAGPVTAVQASVGTLRKKIRVDDNAVSILEFNGTCLGYIEVGWTSPAGFCGIEVMGDKGSIWADYSRGQTLLTTGVRKPSGESTMETNILVEKVTTKPWVEQMRYFIGQLGTRKAYTPGIADGISSLAVALAAYESSRTGKRVKIKR